MTKTELKNLKRGDIVRNVKGDSYVVIESYPGRVTAIREAGISHPAEWEIVRKSMPVKARKDKWI